MSHHTEGHCKPKVIIFLHKKVTFCILREVFCFCGFDCQCCFYLVVYLFIHSFSLCGLSEVSGNTQVLIWYIWRCYSHPFLSQVFTVAAEQKELLLTSSAWGRPHIEGANYLFTDPGASRDQNYAHDYILKQVSSYFSSTSWSVLQIFCSIWTTILISDVF